MAGNQVHHQEKIDVSVDQRDKESPLNEDSYTEEVGQILSGQIFAKQLLKTKSIEGHSSSKKKSTSFQITSVVDRSGLYHTHEDGDSVDDLDDTCETHTEDVSSDILDQSKNTDIEPEPSSSEETTPSFVTDEIPITKDLTSRMNTSFTQNQTNYQGNDSKGNDMQSRFKVVKIESQEPFTRGRWTCQDYLDPQNEKSVERTEKTDKPVEEVGSGNSSAASSIHYVHGVDDPSKNPLASSGVSDGHAVVEPQPVYPTTSQGQIIPNGGEQYTYSAVSQTGKQGGVSVPAGTEQQVGQNQTYDVNQMIASPSQVVQGQQAPNSEQSSHSQQSGKAQTLVTNGTGVSSQQTGQSQSNSPAQPDYDYNQGVPSQMSSQGVQLQQGPNPDQNTGMPQGQDYIPDGQEYLASNHEYVQQQQGQDFMPTITSQAEFTQPSGQSGVEVSQSSQTPIASQPSMATSQSAVEYSVAQTSTAGSSPALAASDFSGQSPASSQPVTVTVPTSVAPNSNTSPNNDNVQASEMHAPPAAVKEELTNSSLDTLNAAIESKVTHTTHIAKPEGASAIKTSASQTQSATSFLSPPLLEMVTATMGNVTGSVNLSKEEGDESGASTVAIDNKIEQAMDLVKSHLMFAVREEVEVLKEQIKELLEKNTQLEVENNILKKSATPETLAKLNQATSSQVPPTSTS